MTAREIIGALKRAYFESDFEGWEQNDGPYGYYELDIGSGWRIVSDVYGGHRDETFKLFHDGETRALFDVDHIEFEEDTLSMTGDDRVIRIPITDTNPEGDGIPPLTREARDGLIDLVMGGCYRDIDENEVMILDEKEQLRIVLTSTGDVYSLPQVICRVTFSDPTHTHPDFDFVGRLGTTKGNVSIRHWDWNITFGIPSEEIDVRLKDFPPKVPSLREWLKGRCPEGPDPNLSPLRADMERALGRTGF